MARMRVSRLFRDNDGASAVEFAFVFPLFLMFIFGVVEFGQGLKVYNELASAASRASRLVMLDKNVANSTLETNIRNTLHELTPADLQVAFSTDTISGKTYRIVNITYPHQFTTPFLDTINVTLSATSRTPEGS